MRDPAPPQWGEPRAEPRTAFPLEPRNTVSNAAYLVAAVFSAMHGAPGVAGALALVVLAVGSAAWHGTQRPWAQTLDRFGMHLVFAGLAVCAIAPHHPATPWLMLAVGAGFGYAFTVRTYVSLDACMAIYLVLASVGAGLRSDGVALSYSLTLFLLAFLLWTLDHRAELPFGRWGHALWHGLTAAAIALLGQAVYG